VAVALRFQSGHSTVSWADPKNFLGTSSSAGLLSDSEDEDDIGTDQIVRSTGKLLDSGHGVLPQGALEICRMKDANQHAPSGAAIQSVQFHSNGQLLLTAGLDKTLHLFQIDGTNNARVENIFLKDLPIVTAKYTLGGTRVVLAGPRSYYFSYDLEAGRITKIPGISGRKERKLERFVVSDSGEQLAFLGSDGYLSLVSARSYEWIGNLKMNGDVKSATYCENDRYILSTGSDGTVYKWDTRTRKCVFVQQDEGSLGNYSIAASGNGKYYATGSSSGVVNVYDNMGGLSSSSTKPRKSLMQLTTQIDHLAFNADAQILAMASKDARDALKLVHVPSMTVFANWPSAKTPLHYVSAMDFSPSSGYFAVGNARGRVLLYRLTHYGST
jgi:U3 small nucleolar RNA-associated protein 18